MDLKRSIAFLLTAAMLVSAAGCSGKNADDSGNITDVSTDNVTEEVTLPAENVTLNFWYTDANMTGYFTAASSKYQYDHPGVTINLRLAASSEYLESINTQSIRQVNAVDVYMLSNEELEQAYLAGLASAYDPEGTVFNTDNFGNSAIRAVTYKGRQIAYPLYFDSVFLVYNTSYVTDVPQTFDQILAFTNVDDESSQEEDDSKSKIEKTFIWPVSDYTFNYQFLSDSFVVGGINGDDRTQVDTANGTVINSLMYFHNLYDFFAIDRNEVDYEYCLDYFIEGKSAFTLARTDAIKKLDESGITYDTACMPDLTDSIQASSLSYTQTLVINPYSLHKDYARDFVKAVTYDYVNVFYGMTGYFPSCKIWESEPHYAGIYDNYDDSTPRPKMMTLGDYYIEMEILLHKVWDDNGDVTELLNNFQNFITTQLN